MRDLTEGDWAGSYPATNAMWVAYLADTLLTKKQLPGGRKTDTRCLYQLQRACLHARQPGGPKQAVAGQASLLHARAGVSSAQKRQLREFRKRAVAASSCGELIWDALFEGLWRASEGAEAALRGAA